MAVVAGTIGIAALYGLDTALQGPQSIDRITVVNDTPYLVDIEVTDASRDGWLKLGPISPGEAHDFRTVIDQRGRWTFHATTGPFDGGEFSITETELEGQHWRVTIPGDVEQHLEAAGALPHPGQP